MPPEPGEAFNNHKIAFFLAGHLNVELIDTEEKSGLEIGIRTAVALKKRESTFMNQKTFTADLLKLDLAQEVERIGAWLRHASQVQKKGVVVGMSGGIDSSVVAALSVRALGKEWKRFPCFSNCCGYKIQERRIFGR